MRFKMPMAAALAVMFAITCGTSAPASDEPKRGGILTYMIPADGGPSLDGHRETTYAVLHATAPFYSVLIRVNPDDPASTTDFVCDLCTEMPQPTDNGLTYTFKIRQGVKFHDGTPLTAHDVAASWRKIVSPPPGVSSARANNFVMVDKIEDPDDTTVIFRLKFATLSFLPALADPYGFIYSKAILDKDMHWYEKHIMGSGPFKLESYEIGQSIKGVRNPDYYHPGQPYLDGFVAIFAPKQAVRVDAIRADRAALEFRGLPPSARDQLVKELGDKITVQESDWNCGNVLTPNNSRPPFDDVRVRRALFLAIDQWHGAPALSKIATVRTVGGIVFPDSPLAATKEELEKLPGYWPDIEKSRAEARRLLKEAGQENLSFEMLNRNVDQPYLIVGTWLVDQFSKIGVKVTQKVVPTGPWLDTMRRGDFSVALEANCQNIVNPIADVGRYLPHDRYSENFAYHKDPVQVQLYDQMLRETDMTKARVLMREYERQTIDVGAHQLMVTWWYRIVPMRSYVKGWKISPSHYLNQDLANIWLDK
ncbi:MAG TPA: ABC transporter substrate-binding protein [Rhodopila sp.]|uniref:ABC transporter substrate-binding protein n=1 Tax=Rhodopila sp. TaxID=2480087 RepID=UPI002B6FDFBD|nr:ABC transporter substrate-binding protein [Rhodopila sp.]HVY16561.1 ABC transporter substrate-binding protein [Rhodopila sp.]